MILKKESVSDTVEKAEEIVGTCINELSYNRSFIHKGELPPMFLINKCREGEVCRL